MSIAIETSHIPEGILKNPRVVPQNKIKRSCILTRVLNKIIAFLKRMQRFFLPWKKSPYNLTDEQVYLRNRLQQGLILRAHVIKPKTKLEVASDAPHSEKFITIGGSEFKHKFTQLDPALTEVQLFAEEVTENVIDHAYDHFLKPLEDKIKTWIKKIPNAVRPTIDIIIRVFNRSAKPIFSRLRNVPTRINSCAETAAEEFIAKGKASKSFPLLNWVCQSYAGLKSERRTLIEKDVAQYLLNLAHSKGQDLSETYAGRLTERLCDQRTYLDSFRFLDLKDKELMENGWKYFISKTLDALLHEGESLQQDKVSGEFRTWLLQTEENEIITREEAKILLKERVDDSILPKFSTDNAVIEAKIERSLNIVFDSATPSPAPLKRSVEPETLTKRVYGALISLLIEKKFHMSRISFEDLEKTNQNLLNWLLKEKLSSDSVPTDTIEKDELKKRALKKTEDHLQKRSHSKPQLPPAYKSLDDHVGLIVDWFFNTTSRVSLDYSYNPEVYDVEIVETIFENVLQLLLQTKIDSFFDRWHTTINDRLTDILQNKILKQNGQTIVKIMVERVCLLLDNLSYTETFDDLIEVVHTFGQSYLDAQAKDASLRKGHRDDWKLQAQKTPSTDAEKEAQRKALESLNIIKNIGPEAFFEGEFLDQFVTAQRVHTKPPTPSSKALKGFTERVLGLVKSAAGTYKSNTKEERAFYESEQKRIEREILNDSAVKLLNILLPDRTITLPDGTVKTVGGIAYLWYQFAIPEEIIELFKETEKMVDEIFPISVRGFVRRTIEGAKPHITTVASNLLKDLMHSAIVDALHKVFINVAQPDEILRLLCENTLPMLEKGMVEGIAFDKLYSNKHKFAPYFLDYLKQKDKDFESLAAEISPELGKLVIGAFNDFTTTNTLEFVNKKNMQPDKDKEQVKPFKEQVTEVTEQVKQTTSNFINKVSTVKTALGTAVSSVSNFFGLTHTPSNAADSQDSVVSPLDQPQEDIHPVHTSQDSAVSPLEEDPIDIEAQAENQEDIHTITASQDPTVSPADEYKGEKLNKRMRPAIIAIAAWLEKSYDRTLEKYPQYQITLDAVASSIGAYKTSTLATSEHTDLYGELVSNLLFKIGGLKLGVLGIADKYIKRALGKMVGSGVVTYRNSYHNLIHYILRTLKECLSESSLEELFKPKESVIIPKEVSEEQRDKIAKIKSEAIDRVSRLMSDTSDSYLRSFVGGHAGFNNTITTLLERIFKYAVLNEGLFCSITELAIRRLEEASDKTATSTNLNSERVVHLDSDDFAQEEEEEEEAVG